MQFVNIDKFLPYVLPYAEKCPQFVARRAIRDTIIDMAQRIGTTTLRFNLKTVAGQHTYELELPVGITVEQIVSLQVGNLSLRPTNRDVLAQLYPNQDWKTIPGHPQYYMATDNPKIVSLVPCPTENDLTITCEVKITFDRACEEFPAEYYDRYVEAVACGSLVRILSIPSQTFTDMAMAAQWMNMYANYVNEIRVDAMRDFTKEAGRVVFRNIL